MKIWNYRKKRKPASQHRTEKKKLLKRLEIFMGSLCLVLALVLGAAAGTFFYLGNTGQSSFQEDTGQPDTGEYVDQEGLVYHNGKKYRYKENMINILCVGVDQATEETQEEKASGENGQADAIFLAAIDPEEGTMEILGISRDTMTEIQTFDYQGNSLGENTNHLAIAYSYGDGGEESCQLLSDAVSNLFYGLSIQGYVAIRLDGVEILNDAVGGVTITSPDDLTLEGTQIKAGDTVDLTGSQALAFLRYRDTEVTGSNNQRMERQKTYALAFMAQAKEALKKNPALAVELYSQLSADMVTDVSINKAAYLATLAGKVNLTGISSLPGETKQGKVYDEFYVDDQALLDLIFQVFYTQVEEGQVE